MNRKINCYKLNLCLSCPKIGGNYKSHREGQLIQRVKV